MSDYPCRRRKPSWFSWIYLLFWGVFVFSGSLVALAEKARPLEKSVITHVKNIDRSDFNEPSGIVFHPHRKTLFVVGDEGDIGELTTDGTPVHQKHLSNADFEGITCDPGTGLLYVAVEGEEKIIEIAPDNFNILREFYIERMFRDALLLAPSGDGIEAITFVPAPTHPEGGTFYLTNQNIDAASQHDPSILFEVEIPLKTGTKKNLTGKILRYFHLGVSDLSGLHYKKTTERLYVISDTQNECFVVTRAGMLLSSFSLPGEDQEGITMNEAGKVYITQDSGGIMTFSWHDQLSTK